MRTYAVLAPIGPHHERYEPLLAVTDPFAFEVVTHDIPKPDVVRFTPVYSDRWVCIFGTNDSPRDKMRHDARLRGERCQTHPYTRIERMS